MLAWVELVREMTALVRGEELLPSFKLSRLDKVVVAKRVLNEMYNVTKECNLGDRWLKSQNRYGFKTCYSKI